MRIGKSSTVMCAFLLAAGLWVSSARADIIHLKNGSQIVGKIVREEGDEVVIKVSFGELRIAKEDIERVEEEPTPSPTPTPSPSAAPDVGDSPEATEMVSPSPSPEATAPPAEDFTVKPFDEWYTAWHPAVTAEPSGYLHRSLSVDHGGSITLKTERALLSPDRRPRLQRSETIILSSDMAPLSFSLLQSERAFYRSVEGAVSANYVQAKVTVLDEEREEQVAFAKGALVGELPLMKFLQTASLATGSGESYSSFDFSELAAVTVRVKAVGWEVVETAGEEVRALAVEVRVERRGAIVEDYRLWALPRSGSTPSGRIVKWEGGTFGYVYEMATEQEARETTDKWLKRYEKVLDTIGRKPPWYKQVVSGAEGVSPSPVPSPSPTAESGAD